MPTISLVMIAKNEERCIARCLNSLKQAVDEIIVIDTGSTDRTIEIARSFDAKVLHFDWVDDFSAARNYGIEHAMGDWILSLDADEYFTHDPRESLRSFINGDARIGKITIVSRFIRDQQEQEAQALISRIFPRFVRYKGIIHEQLASDLPRVDSGLHVLHDGYYQTNKSTRNIPLLEKALGLEPQVPYLLFQLAKEYKGIEEYEQSAYYYRKGYSLVSSSHRPNYIIEAIVDYLYILMNRGDWETAWEILFAETERLRNSPDFQFVRALISMEIALRDPTLAPDLLPEIERAYLRCLTLGKQAEREIVLGTSSFLASYNLALLYELTNQNELARKYYTESANHGYSPAKDRLSRM